MPLYQCTACGCIENTALTNFWWDTLGEKKPALCSECDPAFGEWHGKFEKLTAEDFLKRFPGEKIDYPAKPCP